MGEKTRLDEYCDIGIRCFNEVVSEIEQADDKVHIGLGYYGDLMDELEPKDTLQEDLDMFKWVTRALWASLAIDLIIMVWLVWLTVRVL